MTRPRRVLMSAFGSAGDLFPLIPAITQLREQGHDVRCAVPRSLGLYLRASGLPTYALGDGSEMRVFDDPQIVTTRFGGWASWRRTATHYVAPGLLRDAEVVSQVIEDWKPDVVVTTSFAAAARLAAVATRDVPLLDLSIYPQHQQRLPESRSFAQPLRRTIADAMGLDGLDVQPATVTRLAWGVGDEMVLLHDPTLVDAPGEAVVGFPYWDGAPTRPAEVEGVETWLAGSDGPTVLVTLGSFLGVGQRAAWMEAAKATEALGVRALFVGPRGRWDDAVLDNRPDVLTVGFVPLSLLAPRIDAIVHHGGIGTTFAGLRAGRPAAVVPQAFDQTYNARLVERAGAGIDTTHCPLAEAIERLLTDKTLAERAGDVAATLVPSEVATSRVVDRILRLAT